MSIAITILRLLADRQPWSSKAVATAADMTHVSAQTHLGALRQKGLAESGNRTYWITEAGIEGLARREARLVAMAAKPVVDDDVDEDWKALFDTNAMVSGALSGRVPNSVFALGGMGA